MCVCVFSPVMNVIENKIAIMEAEPHFVSDSLNYFFNVRVTDFFWSRKNRSLWSSGQVEDNKAATETLKKLIFLLSEKKANFIRFFSFKFPNFRFFHTIFHRKIFQEYFRNNFFWKRKNDYYEWTKHLRGVISKKNN